MSKVKVEVDPRIVEPSDKAERKLLSPEEIIAFAADWDPKDPGYGKAVLDQYGREIFNPVPMAPPIGYKEEVTMMERMQRMLRAELERAKEEEDEGIDDVEHMNEFPEDVEAPFYTAYELIMRDDFPESPRLPEPGELARSEGADLPPSGVPHAEPVLDETPPAKPGGSGGA